MSKRATGHGTYPYAQNHSCKCEPCRIAKREYQRGVRARNRPQVLRDRAEAWRVKAEEIVAEADRLEAQAEEVPRDL